MRDEEARVIKSLYEKKQKEIKNLRDIEKRISELEKLDTVKEYLELTQKRAASDELKMLNWSDKEIICSLFDYNYKENFEEENGVWLYLYTQNEHYENVDRDSQDAKYRLYSYLEGDVLSSIRLRITECDEFENKNIIIFPSEGFNHVSFNLLKREYVERSVLSSPKKAKQYIIEHTNNNKSKQNN